MGTRKHTIFADCPECDAIVRFTKMPKMGYIVACSECDTKLEVIDIDPLELDWAIEMDEDFDDDDDDDFDDYKYDDD
jgi:lysine biosynthesis protein LysW